MGCLLYCSQIKTTLPMLFLCDGNHVANAASRYVIFSLAWYVSVRKPLTVHTVFMKPENSTVHVIKFMVGRASSSHKNVS